MTITSYLQQSVCYHRIFSINLLRFLFHPSQKIAWSIKFFAPSTSNHIPRNYKYLTHLRNFHLHLNRLPCYYCFLAQEFHQLFEGCTWLEKFHLVAKMGSIHLNGITQECPQNLFVHWNTF